MITYLKMINWRAYDEKEFYFKKGITFLMGANGSGKTSILEAISYAFTGEAALFTGSDRTQLLMDKVSRSRTIEVWQSGNSN
jgi:DNA repair exonuclease SbcCD ATPase subunit